MPSPIPGQNQERETPCVNDTQRTDQQNYSDGRPPKRRKTQLACEPCRTKKTKCDGSRPVCSTCATSRLSRDRCVYNEAQKPPSKKLLDELQTKIRDLEKQNSISQAPLMLDNSAKDSHQTPPGDIDLTEPRSFQTHSNESAHSSSRSLLVSERTSMNLDPANSIQPARDPDASLQMNDSSSPRRVFHAVNSANDINIFSSENSLNDHGISAIVGAMTGEPHNEGYHGLSSAAAFLTQIRQAVDSRLGVKPPEGSLAVSLHNAATKLPSRTVPDYVLPPRKLADKLINVYWEYVHPIYPFLHKPNFTTIYNDIWAGGELSSSSPDVSATGNNEATSICILYLVLALSCQWADAIEPEKRHSTATVFFTRARNLLQFDPVDPTDRSVQLVQALLLTGHYLQITGNTPKAWVVIGMSVRICHELGLHLPERSHSGDSPRVMESEIRKRVYHGALTMERMLCMNLGRPVMLSGGPTESTPLPLEIDDEYLEIFDQERAKSEPGSVQQPSGCPSIMSFSVMSARLYQIVQRILGAFYLDSSNAIVYDYDRYFTGPDSVFQIESALMKWYNAIPAHLKLQTINASSVLNKKEWIFHRQSVVLWARFLQVRIYLFRPVVSRFCTASHQNYDQSDNSNIGEVGSGLISYIPAEGMLSHRTALQCSLICAKTAMELISVLYNNLAFAAPWGQKPAWLFSVLHVYLSATVLIAARLQPHIMAEISEPDLEVSWQRSLAILRNCQGHNESAVGCVAALEILYEKLPRNAAPPTQNINQWQETFNGARVQRSYQEGAGTGGFDPSIMGQDPDSLENLGMFDLSDMSWFNVYPPYL